MMGTGYNVDFTEEKEVIFNKPIKEEVIEVNLVLTETELKYLFRVLQDKYNRQCRNDLIHHQPVDEGLKIVRSKLVDVCIGLGVYSW